MGRRGNARLDQAHRHAAIAWPWIDRIERDVAGAGIGPRRARRRSRPFRCRCDRQGEDLPAGFSLLRIRGAQSSVEPPGDRHRTRGRATAQPSSAPRTLATPGDAAFANATLGHGLVREDMHAASICHHGVVIWPTLLALSERTPLSGATLLAAAIIGYEAGAQIGRALFTADLARLYPADRPRRAARRGAGGKPCAWPHRRCRDERRFALPPILVRPERMAAFGRLRDVFPSRLRRPQRHHGDRTGRSRRLRLGDHSRRRSRVVRGLPAASLRPPTSGCSPAQSRKSWPSTTSRLPPAILRRPPRRPRCVARELGIAGRDRDRRRSAYRKRRRAIPAAIPRARFETRCRPR